MGNEMGNRNINGLQVSEQESNETTEVIDHSPNTSFLSLNGLDGLKGVSDYLADSLQTSEEHETENLAAGDFPEPSLAFDDVEDHSQLNSSRENEEKEDTKLLASVEPSTSSLVSNKKPTDLASIESLQEDGNLIHRTIPVGQVPDEECDEVNKESAKALTVLNNADGIEGFPHGLPDCLPEKQVKKVDADKSLENLAASNETEETILLISSTEDHDSPDKLYNSAHRESCKVLIQKQTLDNRGSDRNSENQDSKENTANISSEHSAVSNDAEDSLQSISSKDLHDVHEKPSDPAQSESDESLIQNQIFEERGSEMDSENQDSKESTANKSLEHSDVSNDAEDLTELFSSTDNHDLHEKLSDSAGSESDDSSLIQKQFFEQREKKDAMTWVQGTSGKCNELQDEKVQRGTCGATAFMDISEGYTQQEGQQHCAETYPKEKSCAASKLEEKRSHEPVNAAYLEAIDNEINILLQTNDLDEVGEQSKSEPNGFQEIQDYGKATSEEESQMEDIENDDSFDIQLNGIDPCTEEREEQEDVGLEDAMFELAIQTGYSPILMSKEHKEDPVEETNGVEKGNSADIKDEEKIECGSNKLETHGIVGEQLSELSIANDVSAEDTVILSLVSENGTKNSVDTEINGDGNEEMEKTERLNVIAEVESECPNGEVNGEAKVVADELIDETIAANTMAPTSLLLFEVAQECNTATEAEVLANKEELFTIDILRRNPSENEKQVQDSTNISVNEMMAGNQEQELIPIDSAWCAQPFEPEALQGCGSFENDSSATESVKCVTYEYERSSPEAEESTLNYISKTEVSKQNPPFSLEMEVSATDENIREYRVSTSHEDISKLSDRSPLLCQRKSEDSRVSAEETDSEKPRTPFLNFLKEEVSAKESVEKEGLLQKKTVKESKKPTTTSSIRRERQKPRSSLFSSCMCCTTAIN